MKRFLSWVVLVLCAYFFRVVIALFFTFAFWLLGKIYGLSEALFWVLIFLEGSTALLFSIAGLHYGSGLVVQASDAIQPSKKGTRYIVIGILNAVIYVLELILIVCGLIVAPAKYIAAYIASAIFGMILIVVGASKATEAKQKNSAPLDNEQ